MMRAITAILLLSAVVPLGCANRGMHAPDAGSGAAGSSGSAGSSGQSGTAGDGTGGTAAAGAGGAPTGVAGTGGGATGTGGGCELATDAGASGGACGAMFNFETGIQGATITAGSQAFKSVAASGAFTYCGSGGLAITAMFTGTTGSGTRGELLINLPGAPVDLTGKTITVHVASDPGCSDLYLSMVVNTQSGQIYFTPPTQIRPITSAWQTGTVTVNGDGGSTSALAISLQMFSATGYEGTIYVDELDIR
jgi:hypothetical protein